MTIEDLVRSFLRKIHGKRENFQSVLVYVDRYKTRKYSLRARLISKTHVIDAKAVSYDLLGTSKKLILILDGRLKSERSRKSRRRQHSSIRYISQ